MRTMLHAMRTHRTDHADRADCAVGVPVLAARHHSAWCVKRPITTVATNRRKHKDRRRHAPLDGYLALLALLRPQPIRQLRAARGDTPGRLFDSRTSMDQMPARERLTTASRRPRSSSPTYLDHPCSPSLIRVVPSSPLTVKGIASRTVGITFPDELLAGVGSSRGVRVRPCRLHKEHPGCRRRGGAR